ncbi:hypothetical protein HY793_02375 [Candidatus Desantisbacteria bacterium]|nr:hypothetical protein [Candidatus Desantisbacteria bacterium]
MRIINKLLFWMEMFLGLIIISIVIFGLVMFIGLISQHQISSWTEFHSTFEIIMSNIFLLVIGLEMAVMMIRRKVELLPEILAFVIARKLLLLATGIYEIMLGVLAIAGLFAIRKYLIKCEGCLNFERLCASGEVKVKVE